jgi:hypothetical protein
VAGFIPEGESSDLKFGLRESDGYPYGIGTSRGRVEHDLPRSNLRGDHRVLAAEEHNALQCHSLRLYDEPALNRGQPFCQ